jgi:hypothetical protein
MKITVNIDLDLEDIERHNSESGTETIWQNDEYDIEITQRNDEPITEDDVVFHGGSFSKPFTKKDIINSFNDAINEIHKQESL